ncbi:hypothetical protein BJX96DRAFT_143746 [Aspergillus floccosus]
MATGVASTTVAVTVTVNTREVSMHLQTPCIAFFLVRLSSDHPDHPYQVCDSFILLFFSTFFFLILFKYIFFFNFLRSPMVLK